MTTPESPGTPDPASQPAPAASPADGTPDSPYATPGYGAQPPPAPPTYTAPQYGAPAYGSQPWGAPAYGAPPPGAPPGAYGVPAYPGGAYGMAPPTAYPPNLSTAGKRFGAFLLEIVLAIVTIGIGWIIWDLIVWKDGKSPAKQLLHMQVVNAKTGQPLTWGQCFLRNFVCYGLIGAIPILGALYRIVGACFVFNDDRRALWDRMVDSYVVDIPS